MLRRVGGFLVVAVLVAGLPTDGPVIAQSQTSNESLCDTAGVGQFTDVADADYAAVYVLCMRALGLSVGTSGGSYSPDRELNRGQMATFLVRLWREVLGNDCPSGVVTPFTDVDAGSTHAANIDCLYGLGITTGTGADTYGPWDPLKASQISRFLYRTYRKAGGDMCAGTDGSELNRATQCLLQLRVVPTSAEATATTAVTRAQMGLYMVGLWHNLSGRGLPPLPPLLGAATPTQPTTAAPAKQRLLYTVPNEDRSNSDLWIIDADGGNRTSTKLPDSARFVARWQWSPNGTQIAYLVRTGDGWQLWVADADGTNPTKVTDSIYKIYGGSNFGALWIWSPDGTHISYSVSTGYGWQLWVADADGTNPAKLTDNFPKNSPWLWSPDGTHITYLVRTGVRTGDDYHLWVADADGTNPTKLVDNFPGTGSWGWAPVGTQIAYSVSTGDGWQLWVADADGTNPTKLTRQQIRRDSWRWAPDGTHIAYTVRTGDGWRLWVADTDGTNPTKVTDSIDNTYGGSNFGALWRWAPDGTHIAYSVRTGDDDYHLGVADADGTNPAKLTDNFPRTGSWIWSPDGTHIAYTVTTGDGWQLWVADADGTNPAKLTDNFPGIGSWIWSPDGTHIAYTVTTGDGWQLWVADADGTNPAKLTDNFPGTGSWGWSPDGTHIAYSVIAGDDDYHLWVAEADGTNPAKLTRQQIRRRDSWRWAPDGTQIAYLVSTGVRTGDDYHLWVADADGTNPTKLVDSLYGRFWWSWVPERHPY